VLLLWGAEDRPLPVAAGERFASELGRPAPRLIDRAGHFLQEDRGPEIGAIIADWLSNR
jgi:haloalkane dehalogenase